MVVFYGSQTGTAEEFAGRLAKEGARYGCKARQIQTGSTSRKHLLCWALKFRAPLLGTPLWLARGCENVAGKLRQRW